MMNCHRLAELMMDVAPKRIVNNFEWNIFFLVFVGFFPDYRNMLFLLSLPNFKPSIFMESSVIRKILAEFVMVLFSIKCKSKRLLQFDCY